MPLAVKTCEVATPEASVFTFSLTPLPENVPLGPLAGAAKVTGVAGTTFPKASVRDADRAAP